MFYSIQGMIGYGTNFKPQTLNTALPLKCATQQLLHSIPAAGHPKKR
jgi:hypothetical protein